MKGYSIIIPTFNCASELRQLLEDIIEITKRYRPRVILVSDDGSTDDETKYIPRIYTSSLFPMKLIENEEHKGPFYAERAALEEVDTEYAIILHSDIRLQGKPPVENLYSDILSVLISYISQTDDALIVSAYSLALDNPKKVHYGPRSLGRDKLPYSYYRRFNFYTIRGIKPWCREFSADGAIYALRMKCYREVGGFDEAFAPYLYYHDDFCARARQRGYHVYFTKDVVAYHPRFQNKPQASLAVVNPDLYTNHADAFKIRWKDSPVWVRASLEGPTRITEWIGRP